MVSECCCRPWSSLSIIGSKYYSYSQWFVEFLASVSVSLYFSMFLIFQTNPLYFTSFSSVFCFIPWYKQLYQILSHNDICVHCVCSYCAKMQSTNTKQSVVTSWSCAQKPNLCPQSFKLDTVVFNTTFHHNAPIQQQKKFCVRYKAAHCPFLFITFMQCFCPTDSFQHKKTHPFKRSFVHVKCKRKCTAKYFFHVSKKPKNTFTKQNRIHCDKHRGKKALHSGSKSVVLFPKHTHSHINILFRPREKRENSLYTIAVTGIYVPPLLLE